MPDSVQTSYNCLKVPISSYFLPSFLCLLCPWCAETFTGTSIYCDRIEVFDCREQTRLSALSLSFRQGLFFDIADCFFTCDFDSIYCFSTNGGGTDSQNCSIVACDCFFRAHWLTTKA